MAVLPSHCSLQVIPCLHGGVRARPACYVVRVALPTGDPRELGGGEQRRQRSAGGHVPRVVAQADAAGAVAAAAAAHGADPSSAARRAAGEAGARAGQQRLGLQAEGRAGAQRRASWREVATADAHTAAAAQTHSPGPVQSPLWRVRERGGPDAVPRLSPGAQALVEERLLQGEALVALRLGHEARLGGRARARRVGGGGRVQRRHGGGRLRQQLLATHELLQLQRVAPLIERGPRAQPARHLLRFAVTPQGPLAGASRPNVRHALRDVAGGAELGWRAPQRCQSHWVELVQWAAFCGHSHRGSAGGCGRGRDSGRGPSTQAAGLGGHITGACGAAAAMCGYTSRGVAAVAVIICVCQFILLFGTGEFHTP
ncbi:hypothetical protein AALO_G00298650 [Alosa alosa]|uniref:Uncharacterized protein n=1 Tax=Alosa alosa TaxID=278164 RepID=A0AAV6FEZ8_9TELE|nr:hypothetical protein AALO_G00298650 [Alosa alosa]